jgi:hypothetical protein
MSRAEVGVANEDTFRLPPGLPETWAFARDLSCPSCRYNLRMLRTPRCPECGEGFRWQALLQVTCPRCGQSLATTDGQACPRCRLVLDWEWLLGTADPQRVLNFEYATRPCRRGAATMLAVLLPGRFWKRQRLETPPVPRRLRAYRLVMLVLCGLGLLAALAVDRVARSGSPEAWIPLAAFALVLPAVTVVTLPLFVLTFRRFRIRRDQVLRVLAYACSGAGWMGTLYLVAAATAEVLNWTVVSSLSWPRGWPELQLHLHPFFELLATGVPWSGRSGPALAAVFDLGLGPLAILIGFVWWWRFVWLGMRRYLKLDVVNAAALLASTQVVGLLALLLILLKLPAFAMLIGGLLIRSG